MQFNDESTDQGILQDITFWTGADKGVSDADLWTVYTLKDRTRNCNFALDTILGWILQADGRWKFDDINNSGEPTGTFNLTANQNYVEVTGATYLKISKVLILQDDNLYHVLTPVDEHEEDAISMLEKRSSGTPRRYMKKGELIYLDPYPASALTDGLKIFCQENVHYFTITDTTAEPGFAQPFHRLVSLLASADYLIQNEMWGRLKAVREELISRKADLIAFYSSRDDDYKVRMKLRKEDYGARYLGREVGAEKPAVDWS